MHIVFVRRSVFVPHAAAASHRRGKGPVRWAAHGCACGAACMVKAVERRSERLGCWICCISLTSGVYDNWSGQGGLVSCLFLSRFGCM
jgi:hypothetical protein